jgi:glutamate--cysteine ligase
VYRLFEKRLNRLNSPEGRGLLSKSRIGLEKESLRVSPEGTLASTAHPKNFGSALTHPNITTDYSEAMLEFITEPYEQTTDALARLKQIHQFVHRRLDEEMLWSTSMPCVLHGDNSIPIARYGDSNLGMMKTVYRRGLGHRYGRAMQVISGIHFNYSFSDDFWLSYQAEEGQVGELKDFKSEAYFGLTRNLLRYGWLVAYLFGASPAVCKSFVDPAHRQFRNFNENTYFDPHATSLRLGDIGYTNKREHETGIHANYDNLQNYVDTLNWAMEMPCEGYAEIGVEVDGRFEQLNANVLQIENEYYGTVRPKQPLNGLEKPMLALQNRGVEYIELRSLDVNVFEPMGIGQQQLDFLELFMVFCLLQESPLIHAEENEEKDFNLMQTAHRGRRPGLKLRHHGEEIPLTEWALSLLGCMEQVARLLDGDAQGRYSEAVLAHKAMIEDAELTPSAKMIAEMNDRGEGFYHFSKVMSQRHHDFFCGLPQDAEVEKELADKAEVSLLEQAEIEAHPQQPFGEFLAEYFAQS